MNIRLALCLLIALAFNVQASSRFIIDDYEPNSAELHDLMTPGQKKDTEDLTNTVAIIEYLNEQPANEQHILSFLATIDSEVRLKQVYSVAKKLLESPVSYREQGVETAHNGAMWADSRALHLLSFIYLTNRKIDPWVLYHYATALVYFPELAMKMFKKENPVNFAYKIYDQWLQSILDDQYAEDLQMEECQSIPMKTYVIHGPKETYDQAHLAFYSLLSMKMKLALMLREENKADPFEGLYLEGLVKYNTTRNLKKERSKKEGVASWLEGPAYIALGVAAVPALILAQRMSKTLIH